MDTGNLSQKYPHLFKEATWPWGPALVQFTRLSQTPQLSLTANVNIVPYVADEWVILQLHDGSWEIPGGTLEPGETYVDALHRELLEEAGARLISYQVIGAWDCHSLSDKPYRPHLPHPHYFRLVVAGEISFVHPPLNPPGSEAVKSVFCGSLQSVIGRFFEIGRYDLAELYQYTHDLFNRSSILF